MATPTVRRLQLGHELRHLRLETRVSLRDAAKIVDRAENTMSRLETGQVGIRKNDLRALLEYYAERLDTPVDMDWYFDLAKGSEQRGRWSGYRSIYVKYVRMMLDLEADAARIHCYQCETVPGLLQTPAYLRALHAEAIPQAVPTTDDVVQARSERQRVLTKNDAPQVNFVLSESAILRMIGTPEIMREQLRHVAEVAELPNVQLQLLPFQVQTYPPGCAQSFVYFKVPSPGTSGPLEFVYLEELHDAKYLDDPEVVGMYATLWSRLVGAALDPVASRDRVLQVAEDYSKRL